MYRLCSKILAPIFVIFTFNACSVEDAKDAADTVTGGGPSAETADTIEFVSDVEWLSEKFSDMDQASIPWVWNTFLMTQEIGGVKGIPVLFDAEEPPELTAYVKIEVAGSEQLGKRPPLTIYESSEVPLKVGEFTAIVKFAQDDDGTRYDRIPEAVPYVGGKTIFPLYFIIPFSSYDWTTAGDDTKKSFEDAINAGDLSGKKDETSQDIPVPWFDCETTKVTVKYKGDAKGDEYQIEAVKYLAADPQVTLNLLSALTDTFGAELSEQTGFDLVKLKEALESVDAPECEEPDDTDKALFD